MNIEELTKAQLILLALLVSFVTSIATGIVTVSLLDQAPPGVTRTINRVVERTVERVVPDTSSQNAAVATKEVTVVVKEEDLITESIAKNAKSLVRLYTTASGDTKSVLLGLGVFVTKDTIATDASIVAANVSYSLVLEDGSTFSAKVTKQTNDIALLEVLRPEGDKTVFTPVVFAGSESLKLGQTAIALGGGERAQIAIGVISGLTEITATSSNATATSSPTHTLAFIDTTISSKAVIAGSPLINIFGEVIGISTITSQKSSLGTFTPTTVLSQPFGEVGSKENTS